MSLSLMLWKFPTAFMSRITHIHQVMYTNQAPWAENHGGLKARRWTMSRTRPGLKPWAKAAKPAEGASGWRMAYGQPCSGIRYASVHPFIRWESGPIR